MKALPMLAATLMLAACAQPPIVATPALPARTFEPGRTQNMDDACVADYRDGVDYFPQKTRFAHSSQLSVDYGPHWKRVRFVPGVNTGETLDFLLVQCGTPVPKHRRNTVVVEVPIRRLATANESMLGAVAELGVENALVGVPSLRAVTVPSIRARIETGDVHEMYGYGHVSIEPILASQSDVYLTFYSAYPAGNLHPTLWELGVAALPQADHMEAHPLGRAEWIKFLAMLFNREAQAEAHFAQIERDYLRLARLAADPSSRPQVLTGSASSRDTWDTSGSRNFLARLIHDAGGEYFLDNVPHSGSWVQLPLEQVYARAAQAPVWLSSIGGLHAGGASLDANPRYRWFAAVDQRAVYAFNRGYTGDYAYPWADQGMTRPEHALEDAIRVLQPDRLPPGEFHFLRKLQ